MADLAVEGVGIIMVTALGTGQVAALRGGKFGQALVTPGHGGIILMAAFLTFHGGPQFRK